MEPLLPQREAQVVSLPGSLSLAELPPFPASVWVGGGH